MINAQVCDLIDQTQTNIREAGVETLDDIRMAPALVAFSAGMQKELHQLQQFLRDNFYWHYQVLREMSKARRIIIDLFRVFMDDLRLLPPQYQTPAREDRPRAVADYIAGMTDRYAMKEHRRLFSLADGR
jgi:dGTPase